MRLWHCIELLKASTRYVECCGTNQLALDQKLAAIVFTKENLHKRYQQVVDECLMLLEPKFLDKVNFGEPHTRESDFFLRMRYVRFHSKDLSVDEKQTIIMKCNFSQLNSQELMELRHADIVDKDWLLEAHEKALEYCEIEKEQANDTFKEEMKTIEDERDQERKRARKAERERDELREQLERIEKEKENYWSQVQALESFIKGNRLFG